MSTPRPSPLITWPDLSDYGLHFGIVDMPNGERRLVMVGAAGGQHTELAREMGFRQSRWVGLWVKEALQFTIPGGLGNRFPKARRVQLTQSEVRERIKAHIIERQSHRLSQQASRLSWHPNRLAPAPEKPELATGTLSAGAALRQTLHLGMNYLGQEVYEPGDGRRFTKLGDTVVSREAGDVSALFLRLPAGHEAQPDDPDLLLCARGLVNEVLAGKRLHSEDFERYIRSIWGTNAAEDAASTATFQLALDRVMLEEVARTPGFDRSTYLQALRLHEGRPSYWRAPGTLPTPLPVAAVLQSLVATRTGEADQVVDITTIPGSHSWGLPNATSVGGGSIPTHRVSVGGIYASRGQPVLVSGLKVARSDHETILRTLEAREADGMSAFLIVGDQAPGRLDSEFRRVLSHVGSRYEILGLADLDAPMVAPGNPTASRLLVVGAKRPHIDQTFSVPVAIPVHYDYDALWSWAENIRAATLGEEVSFGDDVREENRWQAPYIPASQVSEPEAMSPRNLLGPVRKALARIIDECGMGIDEYVAEKLQWGVADMEKRLSSEQVDSTALGIYAMDHDEGFVLADATGLGKGRTLAALARYAKLKGRDVVFVTDKAQLYRDFYRDLDDVGTRDLFANPLVLNSGTIVYDEAGAEIGRSPNRETLTTALTGETIPSEYGITLAAYSQFNRPLGDRDPILQVRSACRARDLLLAGSPRLDVLAELDDTLSLYLHEPFLANPLGGLADAPQHLAHIEQILERHRAGSLRLPDRVVTAALTQVELLQNTDAELQARLSKMIGGVNQMSLKQSWIRSPALANAFLILDESHTAAGPVSQTNTNLRHAVSHAKSVLYSSATFAKDTANFGIYSRIFPRSVSAELVAPILDKGGAPLQEILSAMLAEDGRMVRREHDLSGLEFRASVDTGRTARNEVWANSLAEVLASMSYLSGEIGEIANNMDEALKAKLTKGKSSTANRAPTVGVQYTNFSSRFYNVNRAFMMTLNADLSADLAIKALNEGRKPLITVENTLESVLRDLIDGQAFQAGASHSDEDVDEGEVDALLDLGDPAPVADEDEDSDFAAIDPLAQASAQAGHLPVSAIVDPLATVAAPIAPVRKRSAAAPLPPVVPMGRWVGFRDVLRLYADNLFFAEEVRRKNGKVIGRKRLNLATPEMAESVKGIYALIDAMPEIPLSPLDLVRARIVEAGYSVDELSGRKLAVREEADGTHAIVRMPTRNRGQLIDAFNNGQVDALVLSKAGATGFSFHAGPRFDDQSQRELIELQPAADIAQRLQFWGRVHRKGQLSAPIIHMVSSGLPGELRLMTMQNAKLRKLSANISGNADNSAVSDAPDILNRIGNEVCYRWMENNPKIASVLGFKIGDLNEDLSDSARFSGTQFVDKLTGRVMMLDVAMQRQVYAEITAEFKSLLEQYELEGRNPLKSGELDVRATRGASEVFDLPVTTTGSVFDAPVMATEIHYSVHRDGIKPEVLIEEFKAGRSHLAHEWGGVKYLENLRKAIEERAELVMPNTLGKAFASVEEALAADKPNATRNFAARTDWLLHYLPRLVPGSVFALDGKLGETTEVYVVTQLKIPDEQLCTPSAYEIRVRGLMDRRSRTLSLASLQSMGGTFRSELAWGSSSHYDKLIGGYLTRFEQPIDARLSKVILEGNLFRAAELAEQHRVGRAITYTDDKGVWHHALLLPVGTNLADARKMPIQVNDPQMLAALMSAHQDISVQDTFRFDDRTYALNKNRYNVQLRSFQTAAAGSWLLEDPAVLACLLRPFRGSRKNRDAYVNPADLEKMCVAIVDAAQRANKPLLVDGKFRKWILEYAQKNRVKTAAELANEVLTAAASSHGAADELDELAGLTATPPPADPDTARRTPAP